MLAAWGLALGVFWLISAVGENGEEVLPYKSLTGGGSMESMQMNIMILGFFWLMIVLIIDFGLIVIALFLSGIGNIILAIMVLVDLRRTWLPLAVIIGGPVLYNLVTGGE